MIAGTRTWVPVAFLVVLLACAAVANYEFPVTCTSDANCRNLANTKCNSAGRCECLDNYTQMNQTACGKGIRDRCEGDTCDANNSLCYNGVCICRPPYVNVNYNLTFCYKTPEYYGDLCNTTAECPELGDGTQCKDGRCGCLDDFAFDSTAVRCKYKIGEVGKQCNENQICHLEKDGDSQHIKCLNGICTCLGTLSSDKQSCSEFSVICSSDYDCRNLANTKCNSARRCECLPDYTHFNETGCGKGVRNRCDNGRCDANNSVCWNDVCICRPPTLLVNYNATFCYKAPEYYGDLCDSTNECPDHGDGKECKRGRCECQDNFIFDSDDVRCKYKIDEVGKQCNDNQICYLEKDGDDQYVKCVNGVCTCEGNLSKDKQSCTAGAAAVLASATGLLVMLLARALA